MSLELCPHAAIETLLDELVVAACRTAPTLPLAGCRELLTLIFVARLRQTTACGHFAECQPDGGAPVAGATAAPPGARPAGWHDPDPDALPAMFAAAAIDRMPPLSAIDRAATAARLAERFRAIMAPVLLANPRCGASPVCAATPTFPLGPRRG